VTVTADPRTEASPPEEAPAMAGDEPPRRRLRRAHLRRAAAWVAVGLVTFLLAIPIVEDPIAHVWYESRQGELASEHGSVKAIRDGRQVGVLYLSYPVSGTDSTATSQKLYVVQGDSTGDLRGGPGHQPFTPMPGQRGNVVIFGHKDDWGAPFAHLHALRAGGQILAQSVDDTQETVYTIKAVRTIAAGDSEVLAPTDDYRLTLVTDAGGRSSSRWLVVTAVSGPARPGPASTVILAGPAQDGVVENAAFAAVVVSLALGGLIVIGLRRRAKTATLLIMLTPLAVALLLGLVLEFDLIWTPLA
jgi:hypothetical protein